MTKLTLEELKAMKPHTIFAKGTGLIIHPWFNDDAPNKVNKEGVPDKDGRYVEVNWVAIRGGIHDWAIYHSLDANFEPARYLGGFEHLKVTDEQITRGGAKLHNEEEIKKLVSCTDEAFGMYRH